MFGADGNLVNRVFYVSAANVTPLRRTGRIYRNNPTAVLRYVVSNPFNKLAAIPPTVLHRIADPTQVLYSHDGVASQVREVSYLLRGENDQFTLLARGCLTVELGFVESRHPALAVAKELARFLPQTPNLPFGRTNTIP